MENKNGSTRDKRKNGVSVIIPTYGRPDYLERLLISIINQTQSVDEIIVINDNSPNLSEYELVIEKYKEILPIMYIISDKNQGAPACRNMGIKASHYSYLALTDDDDEWEPQKNELEYSRINRGDIGLVYTHGKAIDDDGNILYEFKGKGKGNDLKSLLRNCFIPSSSVMVTYEAISDAGLFDINMPSCQDWDMWTRILEAGFLYDVIESPLLKYHKHSGASIGTSPKAAKGYKLYYRKHFKQYIRYFLFTGEFRQCLHAMKIAFLKG